eukprot:CAMPEP_0179839932 /NCGR_PEP_ID=MMETSP0982-20121206/1614_1 /TAXON_ID=483367 /ORGANISM="non described non described, Strain CCMP 2436" /LENGTH=160 /DNA_ID=CAMNT_0021723685 /DNA_START=46 /DNA_END=529 /DNA_ORIENTATION=-
MIATSSSCGARVRPPQSPVAQAQARDERGAHVLEGAPVAQPAGRRLERVRHRRAVDLGGDGEQHRLRVSEFGGRVRTEELSGAFQKKQAQDGGYFAAELGGAGSEQRVHFELEEGLLEDARVRLVAVGLAGRLARLVVNHCEATVRLRAVQPVEYACERE